MLVTREYDYALRILRALSPGEQRTVKEICDGENIPQPYSYKILKKLENASIVKGHRGNKGGYRLTTSPDKINLYDVYTAIEGELYINECMQEGYACPHNQGSQCTIHRELGRIQRQLAGELKSRSMADVLAPSNP